MAHSRRFLERCQKLKERGVDFQILQGSIVSRGFADLGFEEFAVLSSTKLVSLYTGNQSSYLDEDIGHLFVVPTIDMMIDYILKRGYEVISVSFIDQRKWRIEIANVNNINRDNIENHKNVVIEEDTLEQAWLETLLITT